MRFLVLLILTSLSSLTPANADDWPQFLGPKRTGESAETGLFSKWPADGPGELWRTDCVGGLAGIVVVGDLAITMTQNGNEQAVAAFNVDTGKPAWRTAISAAYKNQMGNGPRATPTVHGKHVFAFAGDGVLAAIELSSGNLVWKTNVLRESGGPGAEYGMSSSPLIHEDLVIVTAGVPGATLVACDQKTGKIKWSAGTDNAGYSSAIKTKILGNEQIVAFTAGSAAGYDPNSGKRIWDYPYKTDYECNVATPLVFDDHILISSGENHGSVLLKAGTTGVSEVWKSFGRDSVLRAEWQTPIRVGNYIYGMDNVGSAGQVTHLTCIEAKTGKRVWQERRFGKGNLTLADGKLWITTMKGELVVVNATPDGFEELGRKKYLGKYRQAPAISNGRLFFRDEKKMVCLKIAE